LFSAKKALLRACLSAKGSASGQPDTTEFIDSFLQDSDGKLTSSEEYFSSLLLVLSLYTEVSSQPMFTSPIFFCNDFLMSSWEKNLSVDARSRPSRRRPLDLGPSPACARAVPRR
jgi:hypothetical protein